ncbi:MAG: proline--tRNA ligase [Candidatus Woesearchaeota archaeon]|nr:MAG: proline--tRNA ligase [Candidatus Woesearchaeota archaeon]
MLENKKGDNFSEWYSEIIKKAELADLRYNVQGFLVHRWWSTFIMKKMFEMYKKEFERTGHKEVMFPLLIPKSNFVKEADHAEGFGAQVFWVTEAGTRHKKLEEPLGIRPTSETAMYTMYSYWIRSWRDLPFKRYQEANVYRYEPTTRPFLRGREFFFLEAHNVFETKEEAEAQILEDMEMSKNVLYKELGMPFLGFKRPQWDKFAGSVYTCAADTLSPDGRALQQPSSHFYGQNFSKAFGIKFKDEKKKDKYGWQTTYGPAPWRFMASIISIHGDNKGLILPFSLAPYQIVIIPIFFKGKEKGVLKECKKVAKLLKKYRVHIDDRPEYTAGSKYHDWEIKGVPVRIEIGPQDIKKKQAVVVRRDTSKKHAIKQKDLLKHIKKLEKEILDTLRTRAEKNLKQNIRSANTYSELKNKIRKGGFIKVNFCSIDLNGEKCAEKIKEELQAEVRGERIDKREKIKPGSKCVICGKKASHVVYIAKQY